MESPVVIGWERTAPDTSSKMVHNGIEYGDMQLICEAYHLMKDALGMDHQEMATTFEQWNKSELDSFLIEITQDILKFKDSDGKALVSKIYGLCRTGSTVSEFDFTDLLKLQKGTGKWTAIASLDFGVPVTLIGESVFARCLSSLKQERVEASKILKGPQTKFDGNKDQLKEDIRKVCFGLTSSLKYNFDIIEGLVCFQNRVLCPGIHVIEGSGQTIQVEPQLRRHSVDVARRMYHSKCLLGQH